MLPWKVPKQCYLYLFSSLMNNEEEQDKSEDSDDSEFSLEGEALMEVQVGVHVWS